MFNEGILNWTHLVALLFLNESKIFHRLVKFVQFYEWNVNLIAKKWKTGGEHCRFPPPHYTQTGWRIFWLHQPLFLKRNHWLDKSSSIINKFYCIKIVVLKPGKVRENSYPVKMSCLKKLVWVLMHGAMHWF